MVVVVGNNDDCGGDEEGPGEAGDEVGDNADGEDNYPVPVFALEVKGGEVRVGYVLLLVWGVYLMVLVHQVFCGGKYFEQIFLRRVGWVCGVSLSSFIWKVRGCGVCLCGGLRFVRKNKGWGVSPLLLVLVGLGIKSLTGGTAKKDGLPGFWWGVVGRLRVVFIHLEGEGCCVAGLCVRNFCGGVGSVRFV